MSELTPITLLAPHQHAGRSYPAGARLALPAASAEWLIGLSRATRADARCRADRAQTKTGTWVPVVSKGRDQRRSEQAVAAV